MLYPAINRASPQSRGLAGLWPLHEAAGARAGELVAGRSGTVYGEAKWIGGPRGSALNLDGTDDYIETNRLLKGLAPNDGAFSAWFKPGRAFNSSAIDWIAIAYDATNGTFQIGHYSDNFLYFGFTNGGRVSIAASASNWPLNTWAHYVVTWQENKSVIAYVNGRQLGSAAFTVYQPLANSLKIGLVASTSNYAVGAVSDVRIYNRTLSAAEIQDLYANPGHLYRPRDTDFLEGLPGFRPFWLGGSNQVICNA